MTPLWALDNAVAGMALGALGLLILLGVSRARQRSAQRRTPQAAEVEIVRQSTGLKVEPPTLLNAMDRCEVRLHELAREIHGRLESRLSALQALVAEADRAAARLERALAASRALEMKGGSAAESAPEATAERADALSDGRPHDDAVRAQRPRDEVLALAAAGYSADEIARRLGMPLGEVTLIVNLRAAAHGA